MNVKSLINSTGRRLGYEDSRQSVSRLEWVALLLISLFCFFSFSYIDLQTIMDNTVLFARSVVKGNILGFYDFSIQNYSTNWAANYEIVVYIVFAIWNLPVLAAIKLWDVDYATSIPCVLWEKTMIVLLALLATLVMMKILREFGLSEKRVRFGAFLFLSATYLIFGTLVQTQCDIISILFMLLGLLYYIREDNRRFVLFFALSVPFKMFSIFIFVPLLLLREKRISRLILSVIGFLSFEIICKLPYIGNSGYKILVGATGSASIASLSEYSISVGNRKISVFVVIFLLLCIYCFAKKLNSKNELLRLSAYIPAVSFGALMLFYPGSSYWLIILVPFTVLVTMSNPDHLRVNLLLDAGIAIGWVCHYFTAGHAFTNLARTSRGFFLLRIFGKPEGMDYKYSGIDNFLGQTGLRSYMPVFVMLLVSCIIAFCVLNYPRMKNGKLSVGNTQPIEYSYVWIRMGVTIAVLLLMLFVYFSTTTPTVIDTTADKTTIVQANLIDGKNTISQPFSVTRQSAPQMLTLRFDNHATSRMDVASVSIAIKDETGKTLTSKRVATTSLNDEKNSYISLKGLTLPVGEYTVEINGSNGKNKRLYPITTAVTDENEPALLNGVAQDYSLYLKLK